MSLLMSQDFEVHINVIINEYCTQFLRVKSINTVKSHTSEIVPGSVPFLWEQESKVWIKCLQTLQLGEFPGEA